jgi:hypothetical protein
MLWRNNDIMNLVCTAKRRIMIACAVFRKVELASRIYSTSSERLNYSLLEHVSL